MNEKNKDTKKVVVNTPMKIWRVVKKAAIDENCKLPDLILDCLCEKYKSEISLDERSGK